MTADHRFFVLPIEREPLQDRRISSNRIATHILTFEGDGSVFWFEGKYSEYEKDRHSRLGAAADQPHRIRYRHLTRE